jgi:acetyl esterase/lipase
MYELVHSRRRAAVREAFLTIRSDRILMTLACAAFLATGQATADEVAAEVGATPMLGDAYPRLEASFPGGVVSRPDVVYATRPGFRPLRLDLYLPGGQVVERPLVVYIHGGGWQSGHTRHSAAFANWPAVLASLARKGYVVASIEYRLSGEARFPAALEDVKTAVRWLRSRAAELGVDRNRAVLWGGSAGGHLAALAAMSCGVAELTPKLADDGPLTAAVAKESDCVQGLVAWYGVFDFKAIGEIDPNAAPARFLGCSLESCSQVATLASPIAHLDARDPPALLIHGEQDRVVSVGQSRAFQRALQTQGIRSTLIIAPDVDHSFIGPSAAGTRTASLEALRATFDFIDGVIGEKRQ